MKITTPLSNAGAFDYVLTAEVSDSQRDYLARLGLLQITQRTPISSAEKAIAGHAWPKNRKGEPQRPKGFERDSIAFSEENAEVYRQRLSRIEIREDEFLDCEVIVTEHVAAAAESKWAEERKLIAEKSSDPARLQKLADKVGYLGDDLSQENAAFCSAIRTYVKNAAKQLFADHME